MDGAGPISLGRIGPNAVIQLGTAMHVICGAGAVRQLFDLAQCRQMLDAPPTAMIDEAVPARLFATLWACWPRPDASMVAREAGRRTADYVIAHRIPRLAQLLLSVAPRRLAARLLLQAIRRNAWTFAGSGHCAVTDCAPYLISITDNPLIMPDCTWHVAVFERLFDRLVARGTQVRQTACSCYGDPACRFEVTLPVP